MGLFTDRSTSAAPHTLSQKEDAMRYMQSRHKAWAKPRSEPMRKLDSYAFVGAVVAIAFFLWWIFTTIK